MDLAVWLDGLEQRIVDDFAVDRDGRSVSQLLTQAREARVERVDKLADVRSRHLYLVEAAGPLAESARQDDRRHGDQPPLFAARSSSRSTRGGDIGSCRTRTPVASCMALAMAGIGGTMGTSPTPRTP